MAVTLPKCTGSATIASREEKRRRDAAEFGKATFWLGDLSEKFLTGEPAERSRRFTSILDLLASIKHASGEEHDTSSTRDGLRLPVKHMAHINMS